jgi:hypothetical protein
MDDGKEDSRAYPIPFMIFLVFSDLTGMIPGPMGVLFETRGETNSQPSG